MHIHIMDNYTRALFDQLAQAALRKARTTVHTHYAIQGGFGQVGTECAIISARVVRTILMQLAMREQHSTSARQYLQACQAHGLPMDRQELQLPDWTALTWSTEVGADRET